MISKDGNAYHMKMYFIQKFLLLSILSLLWIDQPLVAAPWKIEAGNLSVANEKRLKERYPIIQNSFDLQMLLKDAARLAPFASLEASFENNFWVLRGRKTAILTDIRFRNKTSLLRNESDLLSQKYIGTTDSLELRSKLTDELQDLYKKNGFPNANVKIKEILMEDATEVEYLIRVDEGYPCVVKQVDIALELPKQITFPFKLGSFCNEKDLSEAQEEFELKLQNYGYKKLRLNKAVFKYDAKNLFANIFVSGDLGRRIRYEAHDNSRDFSIFDIISNEKLESLDPAIVGPEALGQELSKSYRAKGFDDVQVSEPEVRTEEKDLDIYRYKIDPGPQYFIGEILFEGAKKFSKSELIDALGVSGFWSTATPLNLDEIRLGLNRIRAMYAKQGYWDTTVRDPVLNKNRDTSKVQLIIAIEEGANRVLEKLIIEDPVNLDHNKIIEALDTKEGDALDRNKLVAIEQAAREMMVGSGYLYGETEMELRVKFDKNRTLLTTIVLKIIPQKRVKIGEITISGLIRTRPHIVRRELMIESGDWYDPELLEQTRVNLLGLGLFRSIQIVSTNRDRMDGDYDYLDITIDLRESKPGSVSFGPGWSLAKGSRFTVESSYNNLFGTNRQLFTKVSLSEEAYQSAIGDKTLVGRSFTVGYLEPYVFNLPLNGSASVNHTAKADLFWTLTRGGEISLSHKFKRWLKNASISPFYGQKIVQEYGALQEKRALLSEDVRIARVGLRFQQDRKNDPAWPTKGYILNSEISWARYAFGGDISYFYWELVTSRYFEISPKFVFAAGLNLAAYEDVDREASSSNDVLPYSERLHAGGADTVRGFTERSLGPYALFEDDELTDASFGGSHRAVFKLELRYQLVPNQFGISFFVDSGNAFFTKGELSRFEQIPGANIVDNAPYRFEELVMNPKNIWVKNYRSFGLALNYLTPLGSFNLAYGIPWDRCPSVDTCQIPRGKKVSPWLTHGEFHINVGAVF